MAYGLTGTVSKLCGIKKHIPKMHTAWKEDGTLKEENVFSWLQSPSAVILEPEKIKSYV